MKYTLIDREKAPRGEATSATTERRRQSERLVADLVPAKVAKIELGQKDTPRGVKASLTRAAKRQGKVVRSWDVNGVVYAELTQGGE
ncbi:MAG: hypothetical protein H0X71_08085 [Rubrobacter sp.]|nr:hypothetical protein [Rubrobacter sp.]